MKKVLFVTGRTFNLVRSRLPLMKKMKKRGWEVHAAALRQDELLETLELHGINFHHIPFARSSLSIKQDLMCVLLLIQLIRKVKPDLIHYFNPKPIVLGGVVSRLLVNKPIQFVTVTGMGMIKENTPKNRLIHRAYKNTFSQINGIFYENSNDKYFCESLNLACPDKGRVMISSGVNMMLYPEKVFLSNQPVKLLFASRLIWNKGFDELVIASAKLKNKCPGQAIVSIVGEIETGHPNAVPEEILLQHHEKGVINYLGVFASDKMPEIIQDHDIIVLPSYSEGFSKFLMEGAAAGKPLISSDICGCKEIVEHEKTGLVVPVKNPIALFKAMRDLVNSERMRREFGVNARQKAVREFDQIKLVEKVIETYRVFGF